ncbi:MAG: hypothetical protein ACFE8N_07270 [Promethearchaeota archaeon]
MFNGHLGQRSKPLLLGGPQNAHSGNCLDSGFMNPINHSCVPSKLSPRGWVLVVVLSEGKV